MVKSASEIWRNFVTDGVPSSGQWEPVKLEIREWGLSLEAFSNASGSALVYPNSSSLFADLNHSANEMAWVVAGNGAGVYQKQGAAGTGSWLRVADLPYSFIIASNQNAGNPNSIQASTSLPVSGRALITLDITQTNTSSPVVVSFNGGVPLTIKSNSGNDIAVGGLVSGMIVAGFVSGSTFRLLSDQVSSAVVAAAEDAQIAAEDAADAAALALSQFRSEAATAFAVKLQTVAIAGQLEYSLLSPVPAIAGHLHLTVLVGGEEQPADGISYSITNAGTKILFSEQPPAGTRLYARGAATYSVETGILVDAPVAIRTNGAIRTAGSRLKERNSLLDYDGADPTGVNSSTVAIRRWLSEPGICVLPKGDFVWDMSEDDRGMVRYLHNQIIQGEGSGWGRGADRARTFQPHSRIIVKGTGGRIIRSRRRARLTSGDPQDPATSAAMHVAADNVQNIGWCLWLDTNYDDLSPSNLGADIDYGVFVATRTGYHDEDFQVYGNFRKGGVVLDNTGISGGTILGPSGYTLPAIVSRGTDAWRKTNSVVSGARRALVVQGAIPTGTSNYYDQTLGLIPDTRGSFGASDGFIDGGMYSPDHHSGIRKAAPRGDLNHLLEDEDMPACVYIDGWANNGASAIQGITFSGNYRLETIEAFHARLLRTNRVRFQGGQFDYQGNTDPNYGSVTATPLTSNIHLALGQVSTPIDAYFWNHVVGASNVAPENGLSRIPRIRLDEYAQFAVEAELRSATGSGFRVREGAVTTLQVGTGGLYDTTTASSANVYVTSNNSLQRSTSSGEFKTDVEDLDDSYRDAVLQASRPVFYRSLCPTDNPEWSWYGLIAEDVAAIDPRLVSWRTEERTLEERTVILPDEQGGSVELVETVEVTTTLPKPVPDGVFYDRYVPLLISKIQELTARIEALEGEK